MALVLLRVGILEGAMFATRSKKLLGAPGIATRSKDACIRLTSLLWMCRTVPGNTWWHSLSFLVCRCLQCAVGSQLSDAHAPSVSFEVVVCSFGITPCMLRICNVTTLHQFAKHV